MTASFFDERLPQCRSVDGVQVLEDPLVRCKLSIAAKDSERFPTTLRGRFRSAVQAGQLNGKATG